MGIIRQLLLDPAVQKLDVDSIDISVAHRKVLERKKILKALFEDFYTRCHLMDKRFFTCSEGKRLEIGSGSSIIKTLYPDVITSDIKPLPFVDIVCRAEQIPFQDNELRSIYAINVFHHFPDPKVFFREASRVLMPGGGIILIEPYHGPLARRLFSKLHETEGFFPDVPNWETQDYGPMSNANQALSYVVFKRDKEKFDIEFPQFELVYDAPHTHLWYFLSGGVNFRQLAPSFSTPIIKLFEKLLSPFNKWIALQHTLVIRKRE